MEDFSMEYISKKKVKDIKIAYIGGGSRGWAWGLMSDLVSCDDISGDVYLYDIDLEDAKDLASKFNQESFFYGQVNSNQNATVQFWKKSKTPYVFRGNHAIRISVQFHTAGVK